MKTTIAELLFLIKYSYTTELKIFDIVSEWTGLVLMLTS